MQDKVGYCLMSFEAHLNDNMYFILTDLCSNHNFA
jgi:hypothetical protein